jgi:hypothetical protein
VTPLDEGRRAALVRANARARWILLALAVLVPALLFLLFERQARRLDALADHGTTTTATVTRLTRQDATIYVHYAYDVDGVTYDWSVSEREAPYNAGEHFVVSYLPEAPGLTRPGADLSLAGVEAASNRRFSRRLLVGVVAFFALFAAFSELRVRKLRASASGGAGGTGHGATAGAFLVSPEWAGRAVALVLGAVTIGTNFSADVASVQAKAFGASPFGMPVAVVVSVVEVILFLPYVWVFEHLMRFGFQAVRDRAWLTRAGLAAYVLTAPRQHPELRRSRTIVLVGLAYFVVLVGGWIAYAAGLGI